MVLVRGGLTYVFEWLDQNFAHWRFEVVIDEVEGCYEDGN